MSKNSSEYNKKYRAANLEKLKEYHRQYRKNNKDKRSAYIKVYQKINKEKINRYHRKWCKENSALRNSYQRTQYHKNPGKFKSYRLKRNYGITLDEFNAIRRLQNNCCGICKKKFEEKTSLNPCVDHNHRTNKIRGIIHRKCNTNIGKFNDNISELMAAVEYLKKYE